MTIIEMLDHVALEEMYLTREALLDRLNENTVLITSACCTEITEEGLIYLDRNNVKQSLACDTVVLSAGMRPRQQLAETFRNCAPWFASIGDCTKATNIRNATRTGFDAAIRL